MYKTEKIVKCWFLQKTTKSNKRKKNATKTIRSEKRAITINIEKNISNYKIIC